MIRSVRHDRSASSLILEFCRKDRVGTRRRGGRVTPVAALWPQVIAALEGEQPAPFANAWMPTTEMVPMPDWFVVLIDRRSYEI